LQYFKNRINFKPFTHSYYHCIIWKKNSYLFQCDIQNFNC